MTTFVLLTLLTAFAVWRVRRQDRVSARRTGGARKPRKLAAFLLTVAVLGLQAVITAPPASAAACGEAPYPERTGTGMVGQLDPTIGFGAVGTAYENYGYAGQVWYTYETKCGPLSSVLNTSATLDTWAGNQFFNVAKVIVGATNGLHYTILEGGLLSKVTDIIKKGAATVYDNIYGQLFGLVAILLAIFMFVNIMRGDLARVSKRALYLLAAMWLAASSFTVLRFMDPLDKAIVATTTNIQAGFIVDEDVVKRDAIPSLLHDQVVYKNWLRGEFGSLEGTQAGEFGPKLLDAQAFTRNQLREAADANQDVVNAKKAAYKDIATKLGSAETSFTGEAGGRAGTGVLALAQSLVFSLFQLLSKLAIVLAQVMIRLFVLGAPLLGLAAMLNNEVLRKVGKTVGIVAFNLVLLAVLAGIHALLLQAIFSESSGLAVLTQLALGGIITVLLFMVGRPIRRLGQMIQAPVSEFGGNLSMPGSRIFSRLRHRNPDESGQTPQDKFYESLGNTQNQAAVATGGGRSRPEAAVVATAQREDRQSSGSGATAGGHVVVEGEVVKNGQRALPAGKGAASRTVNLGVSKNQISTDQPPVFTNLNPEVVVASKVGQEPRQEPTVVDPDADNRMYTQTRGVGPTRTTKHVTGRPVSPGGRSPSTDELYRNGR